MEGGGEGRTRKGPKVPWFQDHKNPRFQGSVQIHILIIIRASMII